MVLEGTVVSFLTVHGLQVILRAFTIITVDLLAARFAIDNHTIGAGVVGHMQFSVAGACAPSWLRH